MSFPTTALKYGWVYLTALGVITGTTIYVLNNTRQQVKPEDIIEIALGTYERCLATQTSTNPVIYGVAPTNLVQSWVKTNALVLNGTAYKVCYTSYWPSTTGVGTVQSYTSSVQPSINYAVSWTAANGWVWTNVSTWPPMTVTDAYETVTNTIGWFPDREYMISLDTTIKALVPYYVDTNTVYDGTTNIVMLTVTGLWASLGIGDKTNKFTREPAWTNSVSTNWIVNYTSYWPSTNGTTTNICYTSDYRQVVNYAQSWTATGGHVWATSSNWASEVVTVTNDATYGDYPWQIYVEDLQERYKVLNALSCLPAPRHWGGLTDVGNSLGKIISKKARFGGNILTSEKLIYTGCVGSPSGISLGVADGTLYEFDLPYCSAFDGWPNYYWWTVYPQSSASFIDMGGSYLLQEAMYLQSWWAYVEPKRYFQNPGISGAIFFQNGRDTNSPNPYSAELEFEETTYMRVLNCKYIGSLTDTSVSYTPSTISVFANDITSMGAGAHFEFWSVIEYPFNYCTNKYW